MSHPHLEPTPLRHRAVMAVAIGALTAAAVYWMGYRVGNLKLGGSDFDQLWFAARAMANNQDPYALIGPGREMEWGWPFVYPLTSATGVLPLAWLPVVWARVLFAGLSATALAWVLGAYGWRLLPIMLSSSFVVSAAAAQWPPLMTAALLTPALAWALVFKPNVGAAFLAFTGSRRAWVVAGLFAGLLLAVSLVMDPTWPLRWRASLGDAIGFVQVSAFTALGGPLILLAALRWRRWDARLLLAMAIVPQTPAIYTVLPIGLLAQTRMQALLFCLSTHLATGAQMWLVPRAAPNTHANVAAVCLNVFVYLPWLVVVLRRPNQGSVPALFERATARWPLWLRGENAV